MKEQLILVDTQDRQIGIQEKIEAHKRGQLHRAFSVYIVNASGQLMLQLRASSKYHCGGLWTNTACGHPRPDEPVKEAAQRRLREEMGIETELCKGVEFIYHVPFDNGLTEHEYLHVFIGRYEGIPVLNPEEADGWKWVDIKNLQKEIDADPDAYTYWMKMTLQKIQKQLLAQARA